MLTEKFMKLFDQDQLKNTILSMLHFANKGEGMNLGSLTQALSLSETKNNLFKTFLSGINAKQQRAKEIDNQNKKRDNTAKPEYNKANSYEDLSFVDSNDSKHHQLAQELAKKKQFQDLEERYSEDPSLRSTHAPCTQIE